MPEKIILGNAAEAARDYQLLFGANKNLYRTIPKLQSGNKPGKDRIFWSWWNHSGRPENTKEETLKKLKESKVNTLAANTMAEYHPHGDTANVEVIVGEGQAWANNVMTIVPHGSFGSVRGDSASAGRYISASLSAYAIDCWFDDFSSYSVQMRPSFNEELMEPVHLPSKYPHILVNPQISGIGYALSSNIPPFNFTELLEATITLIRDPKAKIMLVPDSPTGADIIDNGDFPEINKSGIGKLVMRATAEIDYSENVIRFTSIPLQTSTDAVIKNINTLKNEKKKAFEEIIDIQDATKNATVDLKIILASDANPDEVLEDLYNKKTGLKMTYPVGITFVDDFKPYTMGVKNTLLRWIDYRRDEVYSMLNNRIQQINAKIHMNKALLLVFNEDNAEETLKICRKAESRADTIQKLVKRYNITTVQAGVIADMRLYHFNKEKYQQFKADKKELKEQLDETKRIISKQENVNEFIIAQLEDGIKKYGRPRKSKVVREGTDVDSIPATNHLLGISESGYIKKLSLKKNASIGQCGPDNGNITVIEINNRDDVLLVDSQGNLSRISISAIPNMEFEERGVEINRYFKTSGKIVGVMKFPSISSLDESNICMIIVTKNGYTKRVYLKDFKKISSNTICMGLNEGDEIVSCLFTLDDSVKDIVIYTNLGNGIRKPISDIKIAGKTAKGQRQFTLGSEEMVVGANKLDPNKKYLFYITTSGKVKLTELKYFPQVDSNKNQGMNLILLDKNEYLTGIASVTKKDTVMAFRKHGEPVEIPVSEIEVGPRNSRGKKYVATPKGDYVCAFKVFKA